VRIAAREGARRAPFARRHWARWRRERLRGRARPLQRPRRGTIRSGVRLPTQRRWHAARHGPKVL